MFKFRFKYTLARWDRARGIVSLEPSRYASLWVFKPSLRRRQPKMLGCKGKFACRFQWDCRGMGLAKPPVGQKIAEKHPQPTVNMSPNGEFRMKALFLALALSAAYIQADAADFSRTSPFKSVASFVAALQGFRPAKANSDLSPLFTVREIGQPEDPKTGRPICANSVKTSVALWSDDTHALVFATAEPPTEATYTEVGVLFVLSQVNEKWTITDCLKFEAIGKYAEISASLTADAGNSGRASVPPFVTVTELQGGRGGTHEISASYTLNASKLRRLNLE